MSKRDAAVSGTYGAAMGRLLVLYTQADRLIMEACAERVTRAPDETTQLALAKQVGDESRHVTIQKAWIRRCAVDPSPVLAADQEQAIRAHFRSLSWLDFLTDLYVCVEALGSEAVEQLVPLADPGTRESLRVPLADETDHVAFGITRLRTELARLPDAERRARLEGIPGRIAALADTFESFGIPVRQWFEAVGADYQELCEALGERQTEILRALREARPATAA